MMLSGGTGINDSKSLKPSLISTAALGRSEEQLIPTMNRRTIAGHEELQSLDMLFRLISEASVANLCVTS
jgi:hypothetical protein